MSLHADSPILIVEDDPSTSELLALHLEGAGFQTAVAYCGQDALDFASTTTPMLAVLDVQLPDFNGWEVCRRLREVSAVPILMLSGLADAHHRVHGLTLGADDYMQKPFSFPELIARIRAILRRVQVPPIPTSAGLSVDRDKRRVCIDGRPVLLTRSEFRLLEALMARPGHVFGRDELLRCLYPNGGIVVERVIDVHIGQLRQKIEVLPSRPRYVLTERGSGYRFADDVRAAT